MSKGFTYRCPSGERCWADECVMAQCCMHMDEAPGTIQGDADGYPGTTSLEDDDESPALHIGVDLASGPDETRTYCYACGDSGCPACDPLPDFTERPQNADG